MTFEYPSIWFLVLLMLLPLLAWRMFVKRPAAINFSSTQAAKQLPPTWRMRLRWLPPLLRLAALALLIVGLARPQFGRTQTSVDSEGIAIQMVVDRSGSMRAMDFKLDGRPVDRLTALKKVAGQFILGGDGLEGRGNDLIGLVTFAKFADGASPMTLDHAFTVGKLNDAEIVVDEREDGTAIGEGLGLAIERLKTLDESRKPQRQGAVKSKIIVLLTDGENNAGDLNPLDAAKLAATLGIRIYTIGVGTHGSAPFPVINPFTGRQELRPMEVSIDEDSLTKIADSTGGKYFRATDTDSLENIYAAIDKLEKSRVEEKRFTDYRELAIQPAREGSSFPPLLLLSFGLLASECLLGACVFRGIP
ncbi:MAG: VWA domain-containing protein [Pirellulales bacterium]|nr:VWA domain-containing protein [Pirellulales bacterium]